MGELKLRLEPVIDEESKKMMEKQGVTEVEFYRWQRHSINEEIHITKTKSPETDTIVVSIFGKSGLYVPSYDEILLIKQHFLMDKLAIVKLATSITETDELTLPICIYLFEIKKEKAEEPNLITLPKKDIITGNRLIN